MCRSKRRILALKIPDPINKTTLLIFFYVRSDPKSFLLIIKSEENDSFTMHVMHPNLMHSVTIVLCLTPSVLHNTVICKIWIPWFMLRLSIIIVIQNHGHQSRGTWDMSPSCFSMRGTQYQMSPSLIGQIGLLFGRKLPFTCAFDHI